MLICSSYIWSVPPNARSHLKIDNYGRMLFRISNTFLIQTPTQLCANFILLSDYRIWISPWHKKPWHQKGGSQLDSKLSGGPWALKMESGTECTVCAILKMSSDNSSFETGVGILWLMCTWAFQVLYSRAWQTSVATWPGVRDIWMKITKDLHWSAPMLDLSPQMPNLISKW